MNTYLPYTDVLVPKDTSDNTFIDYGIADPRETYKPTVVARRSNGKSTPLAEYCVDTLYLLHDGNLEMQSYGGSNTPSRGCTIKTLMDAQSVHEWLRLRLTFASTPWCYGHAVTY